MRPTLPIFLTWRSEIADELEAARGALAQAEAELREATAAMTLARAEKAQILAAIERIPATPGDNGGLRTFARGLFRRLQQRLAELDQVNGPVSRAAGAVKHAKVLIADLIESRDQLDRIDPPEEVPPPDHPAHVLEEV